MLIVLTMATMMTTTKDIQHITIILTAISPQENIMTVHVMEATVEDIVGKEMVMEAMAVLEMEMVAMMEIAAMTEATALHMATQNTEVPTMVEADIVEDAMAEEMMMVAMGNVLVQVIITAITAIIGAVPVTETEMGMKMKVVNLPDTVLDDVLDQFILITMRMAQMIPLANAIVILVHVPAREGQGAQAADGVLRIAPWMDSSEWHVLFGKE